MRLGLNEIGHDERAVGKYIAKPEGNGADRDGCNDVRELQLADRDARNSSPRRSRQNAGENRGHRMPAQADQPCHQHTAEAAGHIKGNIGAPDRDYKRQANGRNHRRGYGLNHVDDIGGG